MEYKILIKAGIKKHGGTLLGIFVLTLLVFALLGAVLVAWTNSNEYIRSEISRAGFGELTAWVSSTDEPESLIAQIEQLSDVERVEKQKLIFSSYTVNEQASDSEGQLIAYSSDEARYRFFTDDIKSYHRETPIIRQGEVYVSPSMISMFGVKIGDEIAFDIARNGQTTVLTIKGFYEDPFMGSSMIGMKGFLISEDDYRAISAVTQGAGIDALAREGAMLHVFPNADSSLTTAALNQKINNSTQLPQYAEFVHSADAISGFMLVLQNAFSALLIAFVVVLLLVVLVVLAHSITGSIDADYRNMGILKTTGVTTKMLRKVQLVQYLTVIIPAMLLGFLLSSPISSILNNATITTSGVKVPSEIPLQLFLLVFIVILLLLMAFIALKTNKIKNITPMKAIRGETAEPLVHVHKLPPISEKNMGLSLAMRQLATGKRKYISACMVAALLAFFISVIGAMNSWLGTDGKGMMEAFNPADHDIGVQVFGNSSYEDARNVVLGFTDITDTYLLAMPNVSVNGIDYTLNAISEPNRFHILSGRTCENDNEIVVTEIVAFDLGVTIGDTITVAGDSGSEVYTISGIYSCANDMGNNIGMSREGYLKIGKDDPQIWCYHYFLADATNKANIIQPLDTQFGGDVHFHENTWPGLFGIISAMRMLVVLMYGMAFLFILIITALTGSKILRAEQRDVGIYKAIGFTTNRLRVSFALRFGIVSAVGSAIGVLLASILTTPLVSAVMRIAGISNFASGPSVLSAFTPVLIVTLLFLAFAYLVAGKIKRVDLSLLITD